MPEHQEVDPVTGPTPQRWTAKRKTAVCLEIIKGKTTAADVARLHGLTVADVEGWLERSLAGMEDFLKALPKEVADTATYTYDAFRRRVTKNFQGTTTVFVYDGWRSVAEYENGAALNAPARLYVFGTYLDEALMMLVGSTKYYYHANDLYSVAALTNSTGTVVERYKYDPYGKVTVLDATGTAKSDPNNSEYGNPFVWQGQRKDKETGNAYFKNRYYSYDIGRFISRWVNQESDVQFYQFQFGMPTVLMRCPLLMYHPQS